jgi:hypothetical protein
MAVRVMPFDSEKERAGGNPSATACQSSPIAEVALFFVGLFFRQQTTLADIPVDLRALLFRTDGTFPLDTFLTKIAHPSRHVLSR